ncbi:hypothetical protein H5410_006485 [Solanum commersonii]|uniref:Uncharacterized protein n=1 Tax=Solanum commersonii TaxID=4109 RepID=A0A9J6AAE9_SOLCO|nr:hypothetical protein H5410_006485 [Solanum commersonii]
MDDKFKGGKTTSNRKTKISKRMTWKSLTEMKGHHHKEHKKDMNQIPTKKHRSHRRRDGRGSRENHTNLQEGVSKGGNLTYVLHEGVHTDLSLDPKASATPKAHQYSAR